MQNFTYHAPTKVVFGEDAELQCGALAKEFGAIKVLLHYGGGSAEKSGLLNRVRGALEDAGVAYVELGGVVPNPRLSLVRQGIELCKAEGVNLILAVGGGSVIDSSKAIGYGLATGKDPWLFYSKQEVPTGCAPVGCVLTIAAAGSEMSDSSVITNEETGEKRGLNNDLCRCRFACMNPALTLTLPAYQTACGCTDILMHTMERYFTAQQPFDLTSRMAEALMRTVIKNALILHDDPENLKARSEVMWAGSLAHNNLMACGGDRGDWACHQLEHELSGMFDVAHGAGLAAVWGSWARYVYDNRVTRFAQFAENVFGIEGTDPNVQALAGISAMERFYRSIDMPTSLTMLGLQVTDEQIDELAYNCSFHETRTIGTVRKLDRRDMARIYRSAR